MRVYGLGRRVDGIRRGIIQKKLRELLGLKCLTVVSYMNVKNAWIHLTGSAQDASVRVTIDEDEIWYCGLRTDQLLGEVGMDLDELIRRVAWEIEKEGVC